MRANARAPYGRLDRRTVRQTRKEQVESEVSSHNFHDRRRNMLKRALTAGLEQNFIT